MTNRLAQHLTTWRWWYALLAVPAFILGSNVALVAGLVGEGGTDPGSGTVGALLMPVQFLVIAGLALGAIALVARRWPSGRDLGMRRRLGAREIALLVVVFVVSHVLYWLFTRSGAASTTDQARAIFTEMNLGGPLLPAFLAMFSSVILAPVCEELLYRGAAVRPIHDHLARHGRAWLGAAVGIAAGAGLFAMPHLGDDATTGLVASYLLTGVVLGLVYVITGSMTAAMVSHSLQSCFAFGQVLLFGAGDAQVSWALYVLVFGCPLWVFLIARGLARVFPRGR